MQSMPLSQLTPKITRHIALISAALLCTWASNQTLAAETATGTVTGQGNSVAFSDVNSPGGMRMIVGANQSNDWRGAVAFFKRSGSTGAWMQTKKFAEGDVSFTQFGKSVSMNGNGTLAIVGAPHAEGNVGKAYIYEFVDNVWKKATTLSDKASATSQQGESVFISYDGTTAFVGGTNDNNGVGAVWVYSLVKGKWKQTAKLIPKDATGPSRFGAAISSTWTGNRIVVGGPSDSSGIGADWIFEKDKDGKWNQVGNKIVATGGTGTFQNQGYSVAINKDGNLFVAGAPYDNEGKGSAAVFVRETSGQWTQKTRFQANSVSGDQQWPMFGESVAVSARGGMIVVGEPGTLLASGNRGEVFSYTGTPTTTFTAIPPVTASPCQYLGESVAVSPSADFMIAGATATPPGEPSRGGVCFYGKDRSKWKIQNSPIAWK